MPFTINHTPFAATGQLASAAGVAQQKVRDQQYAEAERARQEQIAANQESQARSIAANRELQNQQLLQNQKQFASTQALNQQRVNTEATSNYGSLYNTAFQNYGDMFSDIQANNLAEEKMDLVTQQTNLENKYAAKTFELEEAAAARTAEGQDLANERKNMLNLESVQNYDLAETKAGQQTEAYNNWIDLKEEMDPVAYAAGLVAISNGRSPALPADTKGLTAYQKFNAEKGQTATLTDNDIVTFTKIAESTLGAFKDKETGELDAPTSGWFSATMNQAEMEGLYSNFRGTVGYDARNPTQQRQLDNIFDNTVGRVNEATGDEYTFSGTGAYNQKMSDTQDVQTASKLGITVEGVKQARNMGISLPKTLGEPITEANASRLLNFAGGNLEEAKATLSRIGYTDPGEVPASDNTWTRAEEKKRAIADASIWK